MNPPVRILYVDDYPLDRELVRDALEKEHGGFEIVEAASRADFETALAQGGFDLILSDFNILGFEGLQVLEAVRATGSDLPVIIVTGTGSEEVAAEAIKRGAADYVIKTPKHIQRLPYLIHAVLEKKRLEDERQKVEEAVRQAAAEWETTFNATQDGIYILDNEQKILRANKAFRQMLSLHGGDYIGKQCWQVVHGTNEPLPNCPMICMKKSLQHESMEYCIGERFLEFVVDPILGKNGELAGAVHSVRDITERKQAEEKIRTMNAELEQRVEARTRELREAQEQFVQQEQLAVLGRLAGGVSQELRNPLGIINNAIYFLRLVQPEAEARVKEYLDLIDTETHHASKIISDLLDFSDIKLADPEPVSVSELVQGTLERFPAPENVCVRLDLPKNLPFVHVDPRQMTQVLGNLVVNACQAMTEGGKLVISAKPSMVSGQSSVAIAVKDTGVGIPPENMAKIFEPLFTTKLKGIGLGLAVSRKLAEANSSRIEAQSEPGAGSTFTLSIPVCKEKT